MQFPLTTNVCNYSPDDGNLTNWSKISIFEIQQDLFCLPAKRLKLRL